MGPRATDAAPIDFSSPAWTRRAQARRSLEMELRQAINDGGFEVYYQPLVDLRDGRIGGCEALLRWRHPAARHDFRPPSSSRSPRRPA